MSVAGSVYAEHASTSELSEVVAVDTVPYTESREREKTPPKAAPKKAAKKLTHEVTETITDETTATEPAEKDAYAATNPKSKKKKKPAKKTEEVVETEKAAEEEKTVAEDTKPKISTEKLMDQLYASRSGFGIDQEEVELIQKKGGAPTYGEILFDSWDFVLHDLKITKNDVLYDLGCGVGKVAVQAYLDFPFKKVVGIELSRTRLEYANEVKAELKERKLLDKNRKLEFVLGDITEANIADATVIYMCSTCYSYECMNTMALKLSRLKPGLRVVSLKALPQHAKYGFTLLSNDPDKPTHVLPMTWTKESGSDVYIYKLEGKSKASEKAAKASDTKKDKKKRSKKSSQEESKKKVETESATAA